MAPKIDPFASSLKELLQGDGRAISGDDDGLTTRQKLREKRRAEVRCKYNDALSARENQANRCTAESSIDAACSGPGHQQLDPLNGKPLISNLVTGTYYDLQRVREERERALPSRGEFHPMVGAAANLDCRLTDSASTRRLGRTNASKSTTAHVTTQMRDWHRLPFPVDDRQPCGLPQTRPSTAAYSSTASAAAPAVRHVGVEVSPDELRAPAPPAPWNKVPEETRRGRVPVTPTPAFSAQRTLATGTDLSGHHWRRGLDAAATTSADVSDNPPPRPSTAGAAVAASQPQQRRFGSRPTDTLMRLC